MTRRRWVVVAVVAAAVVGLWRTHEMWNAALRSPRGGDFGSFYYAWRAALQGVDPYDVRAISRLARADGLPTGVHPFFYPPPFLLLAPIALVPMRAAFLAWFWIDAALAAAAAAFLAMAWRGRPLVAPLVAIAFLATAAVPNNHAMGQMNHLVLALVMAGWWADERDRPAVAGALVGVACMLKMSPAFFVAWWVLRGRWRAVAAACVTAVCLSAVSLAVVPLDVQVRFYTDVLPGFGTGDYNGLAVPIGIFGNHSVPDVFNRVWPADGRTLSPLARTLTTATLLAVVGGLAVAFRRPPVDARGRAGQLSAVAVALLLVPVYTYEHHLVWAIPAVVATIEAAAVGRIRRGWLWVGLAAGVVVAVDLNVWRDLGRALGIASWIAEVKLAALLALFAATVTLGASAAPSSGYAGGHAGGSS